MMSAFNFKEIRSYLFVFLVFIVASSKAIIIYNEETLVALSFITFIIFCFYYFGDLVKDSLDERSSLIKFSLENVDRLKHQSLQELLSQHKQIKQLKKIFPTVGSFTKNQLTYTSSSNDQTIILHNRLSSLIVEKLGQLKSGKTLLQQRLQDSLAIAIPTIVVAELSSSTSRRPNDKKKLATSAKSISMSSQVKQSLKLLSTDKS